VDLEVCHVKIGIWGDKKEMDLVWIVVEGGGSGWFDSKKRDERRGC